MGLRNKGVSTLPRQAKTLPPQEYTAHGHLRMGLLVFSG